jgi:hypothetical protein
MAMSREIDNIVNCAMRLAEKKRKNPHTFNDEHALSVCVEVKRMIRHCRNKKIVTTRLILSKYTLAFRIAELITMAAICANAARHWCDLGC